MKNEMNLLKMDERQRLGWLLANRVTLMIVGLVWLGMIGWNLLHHETPWFLIIMIPVFGLVRFSVYLYYSRHSLKLGEN